MTATRFEPAFADSFRLAERLFGAIGARTSDGVGITRPSYGEGEAIARDMLAEAARSLGLVVSADAATNPYMTLPGRDRMTGPIGEIGRRRRVEFVSAPMTGGPPVLVDQGLRRQLVEGCAELAIRSLEIASDPGHDAGDFAEAGIPAAMIVVGNCNGSHNPDEGMRLEELREATRLLLWLLTRLAADTRDSAG